MKARSYLAIASLIVSGPAPASTTLDDLAALMHGSFDTHALQPGMAAEERFVDKRVRIEAPRLGEYVFYQQITHREYLGVYRQRILVLSTTDSGEVEQRAYAFREPEWYVDAVPAAFSSLAADALDAFMPEGCEQIWTRTADGFRGYVDPQRCEIVSSRTGKPRRVESH